MVCDDDIHRVRVGAAQRFGGVAQIGGRIVPSFTVNERVVLRPTATNSGSVWTGRRFVVM